MPRRGHREQNVGKGLPVFSASSVADFVFKLSVMAAKTEN
jgi:hypothetical protein